MPMAGTAAIQQKVSGIFVVIMGLNNTCIHSYTYYFFFAEKPSTE